MKGLFQAVQCGSGFFQLSFDGIDEQGRVIGAIDRMDWGGRSRSRRSGRIGEQGLKRLLGKRLLRKWLLLLRKWLLLLRKWLLLLRKKLLLLMMLMLLRLNRNNR